MRVFALLALVMAEPALAAETDDRTRQPFDMSIVSDLLSEPLPGLLGAGDRLLRVSVSDVSDARYRTDLVYLVRTNAETDVAMFKFERIASWQDLAGKDQENRSGGDRELSAVELAAFRAAFEPLRLCGTDAKGRAGQGGWTVQIEFANETRHCFAERWSPNRDSDAAEFVAMTELLYEIADPLGAADAGAD